MLLERFLVDPDRVAFYRGAVKNAGLLQQFIILSVSAVEWEQAGVQRVMGSTAETRL